MVKGSLKNFANFKVKSEGLVMADARNPPIKAVDCIVTDPPYGRSATTLKRTTKQIIEDVLKAVYDMLEKGRHICMASPKTIGIGSIGEDLGYKHLESHFVYVHKSLTREIAILLKN
jgi:tRNA (guanine10-N2)-dimethyltransferase